MFCNCFPVLLILDNNCNCFCSIRSTVTFFTFLQYLFTYVSCLLVVSDGFNNILSQLLFIFSDNFGVDIKLSDANNFAERIG